MSEITVPNNLLISWEEEWANHLTDELESGEFITHYRRQRPNHTEEQAKRATLIYWDPSHDILAEHASPYIAQ